MIGEIIGKVTLNEIVVYSDYPWGPSSDVDGQTLDLLEQNEEGNCLCLVTVDGQRKGLMDVDLRDISRIERTMQGADTIMEMMDSIMQELQHEGVL